MSAGVSFHRVWRLMVLKTQRNIPSMAPLSTKAVNLKKPVRYTSIKKAKPKTIVEIAKLLQQKTKDTREWKQSGITWAATVFPKPAATNQYDAMVDCTETIIPSAKVQTGSSTPPAKGAEEGLSVDSTLVDKEATQDILDLGAVGKYTPKNAFLTGASTSLDPSEMMSVATHDLPQETYLAESQTFTETTPAFTEVPETALNSPVDGRYSAEISNPKDAEPVVVDSCVGSPSVTALEILASPKVSTQGEMITEVSPLSEFSSTDATDVVPSYKKVASDSKNVFCVATSTPELVPSTDTVKSYNVTANSKDMATSAVLSTHQNGHPEVFAGPETVPKVGDAQTLNNLTDQLLVQSEVLSTLDSTILSYSILNISTFEATTASVSDHLPEVSSPEPMEQIPVVGTISPPVNETEKIVSVEDRTMTGDAPSSIHLKDPVLVHSEVVEEEMRTDTVVKSPEALLDPIQKLFLEKIREYSKKSKSSGGPVDPGPEYDTALNEELAKLQRLFGDGDLTKFPEFKFSDSNLDEGSSK